MEGGNAAYIELITIGGFYTPPGETPTPPETRRIAYNHWYADIPLDPDDGSPLTITVSYQNGTKTVSQNVTWGQTDVLTHDAMTIRWNDSLRLGAILPENFTGTAELTVENQAYDITNGDAIPYKFENPGTIPVTVTVTPEVGAVETHTMQLTVVKGLFGSDPVCKQSVSRDWKNPDLAEAALLEFDHVLEVTEYSRNLVWMPEPEEGRSFAIQSSTPGKSYATARLYAGGPILDAATIRVTAITTHLTDGYHQLLVDFGDGTALYDSYMIVDEVLPDMRVNVVLWGPNTVFEDGTRSAWFEASQFDSNGELHYSVLAGQDFGTCQSMYLYQGDTLIAKLE